MCLEIWAALLVIYCVSCWKIAWKVNSASNSVSPLISPGITCRKYCPLKVEGAYWIHFFWIMLCDQIYFCTTKKQFSVKQKSVVCERTAGFSGRFFCFPGILFGFVLTCFFRQSMCTVWPSDTVIDGVPRSVLALLIVSAPFALSLTVSPSSNVFEQMPQGLCTTSSSMASVDVAPICWNKKQDISIGLGKM